MSQFLQERKFDGKLVEQISNLEQNVTNCQMALEELRHMIEKISKFVVTTLCTLCKILLYIEESCSLYVFLNKYVNG